MSEDGDDSAKAANRVGYAAPLFNAGALFNRPPFGAAHLSKDDITILAVAKTMSRPPIVFNLLSSAMVGVFVFRLRKEGGRDLAVGGAGRLRVENTQVERPFLDMVTSGRDFPVRSALCALQISASSLKL